MLAYTRVILSGQSFSGTSSMNSASCKVYSCHRPEQGGGRRGAALKMWARTAGLQRTLTMSLVSACTSCIG
jgi:hypothetical protein